MSNLSTFYPAPITAADLGLGAGSNATFGSVTTGAGTFSTLNATNGTITASAPVLDLAQTWNNAAVAFTGLRLNVTNTASAAASDLMDVQIGGTTVMRLRRSGSAATLHLGQFTNSGFYTAGPAWHGSTAGLVAATNLAVGSTLDTILERGGAGILDQRNLANAQTFRIFNTTDSSVTNFERGFMRWSSNVLQIGTEAGGTGSARALEFQTGGTTRLTIATGGGITVAGSSFTVTGPSVNAVFSAAGSGVQLSLRNITTSAVSAFAGFTLSGSITFGSGNDMVLSTTTGTKIGTGTTQLLGFYGATPVDRPATVADPTGGGTIDAEARTAINDIIDRLQELGLIA